ncbi:ADP-ribosylation/Crystallin J1 [Beutenbergia cavernae DSM 12333]|uniref:ADP-ribosylation/Crystallin J1 n=1 Tax=Beutenbergia cavernae (strain ATCC BAA-8 / DSM 12333 / CCUG 43141 / JCM 11478 / NBRC 16432 / NCIMB 13614 / HKI 0122) TaxID=471853 RepID=C5C2P4_BEUC1|nr:ADP-ribosylglycohydrolase family protein [Beutenbergia cavernae]ACQ79730.1 ADP-ribosylation/Crystallin J1 [Beutenbergia cavernae DSM 12333]
MTPDRHSRALGALVGQAVGDALGAPTENMTPQQIRARYGWVEGFVSDDPAGTDDTEYAVLTSWTVLRFGRALTHADVSSMWREHVVSQRGGFHGGGFSEMGAIANLRRGIDAPQSGTDNHESWSDGCAMRVVGIGVFCAGDPSEAARLAEIDGAVSHAADGLWCGMAMAAGVAAAMVADDWRDVVDAAIAATPEGSWTRRAMTRAVEIGRRHEDLGEALVELHERCTLPHYPWPDVAPEAAALALGIFTATKGEYVPSVLGGTNIGRDADTIAAMAGALAGALHGIEAVPAAWADAVQEIRGHCIHATAGTRLDELARELVTAGAAA